jgi:hypothetical protein
MDVKSDTSIEDHPMSRSCPNLLQIALLYDSANAPLISVRCKRPS